MSHAARIPAPGTRVSGGRRPALATLAVVIPLVVVIAVAIVLAATGSGSGTQNNVTSGGSAEAQVTHPRAVPPVMRMAPSRGSAASAPER